MEIVKILPLGGCDMVLGVQWLRKIGPTTFNYEDLTLKFKYWDEMLELQGKNKDREPTL